MPAGSTMRGLMAAAGYADSLCYDALTYTGSGASRSIGGAIIAPDAVMIKDRSGSIGVTLFDDVRGAGNYMRPGELAAETVDATTLSAFASAGFSLGGGARTNTSSTSYIAWLLRERAPFLDIVTYTGNGSARTIAHALGVAPSMIWIFNRTNSDSQAAYHAGANGGTNPQNYGFYLSASNPKALQSWWNNTAPTSSVFSLDGSTIVNESGKDYVAYVFGAMTGRAAYGVYTGNGSASGPTVSTGFTPRFLLTKGDSDSGGWNVLDSVRSTSNPRNLVASLDTAVEGSVSGQANFNASSFQIASAASAYNTSGRTYLYAAWG